MVLLLRFMVLFARLYSLKRNFIAFTEVVTGLKFSVDCKNLISVGGDG